MSKRIILLITSALTLALAAPLVDAKPQKIQSQHHKKKKKKRKRQTQGVAYSGIYTGEAEHPPFSFAPELEPYVTDVVFTVCKGRLCAIHVEVRMECPDVAITDRSIDHIGWKGPRLTSTGGFHYSENGVTVEGSIGKGSGGGSMRGRTKDGCEASGVTWDVKKKPGS